MTKEVPAEAMSQWDDPPWSSHRSYPFGEEVAAQINQLGEAKIKTATQAA